MIIFILFVYYILALYIDYFFIWLHFTNSIDQLILPVDYLYYYLRRIAAICISSCFKWSWEILQLKSDFIFTKPPANWFCKSILIKMNLLEILQRTDIRIEISAVICFYCVLKYRSYCVFLTSNTKCENANTNMRPFIYHAIHFGGKGWRCINSPLYNINEGGGSLGSRLPP